MHIPDKDPLHQLASGERQLFLSLWLVLILAFAIWHFYPSFEAREVASRIPVEIGVELHGRIDQADVLKSSPSQHWLRIQVAPRYLRTLPEEGHHMLLGYDLRNDKKIVYSGSVHFGLTRDDEVAEIILPNPERAFTRSIRIYLSQR